METNITFYGKPFGSTLRTNDTTSAGYAIADARQIGGHRTVDVVDDLYELYDWQLVNPSALLNKDTASAVGQKWYVKGQGYYLLKDFSNRTTADGWVKVEDVNGNVVDPNDGKTIVSKIQSAGGDITGIVSRVDALESFKNNANTSNGPLVLNTNGYLAASIGDSTFKKINGVSIIKSASDTKDITIDLSLFIVPADNKLPTTGINANKIYLIKKEGAPSGNIYIEYMYVNSAWEQLGEYKSEVDLTPYLKKTEASSTYVTISSYDADKTGFVKTVTGSPSQYILCTSESIKNTDAEDITSAASVKYVYLTGNSVKTYVDTTLANYAPIGHTHKVTINGVSKTIGNKEVDLGTYLVSDDLTNYTYDKKSIDTMVGAVNNAVNSIKYSSTVTANDTKAPTGGAVYTFVSNYAYSQPQVDAKIESITASSLDIATLSNSEIDTLWTGIFG